MRSEGKIQPAVCDSPPNPALEKANRLNAHAAATPRSSILNPQSPSGTVLAFDFGLQRIGVAVGERMIGSARALETISAADNDTRFKAAERLIREWQPDTLVVGLPLSLDGTPHEMTARARRFARQLGGRFRLPVLMADERLSSVEAEEGLKAKGLDWKKRKQQLDAQAARIILQTYFENPESCLSPSDEEGDDHHD